MSRLFVAVLVVLAASAPAAQARELTFEDRVSAQRSIERVYYSHQIGARKPFEEAVSQEVLERKVQLYLKQSAALEKIWNTPIDGEALRRELQRMAKGTRMPERLRELYAALTDDPLLIQECLARPVLASRLTHGFFAYDERFNGEARREAVELRQALRDGSIDPAVPERHRAVVDLVRGEVPEPLSGRDDEPPRVDLAPAEWDRERARLAGVGEVPAIREQRERFVIPILLDERPGRLRVASFGVAKPSYDEWWRQVEGGLDEGAVAAVAAGVQEVPLPAGGSGLWRGEQDATAVPCLPDDVWDNGSLDDAPPPGAARATVWTGSLMIVWGGLDVPEGWRYDPVTDTWTRTSAAGAPAGRNEHTAVWTGSLMLVWGGEQHGDDEDVQLDTGGRYDPQSDTWASTSTANAPSARTGHTAVWTGSRMVIWGGYSTSNHITTVFDTGGRYDPATDTWAATTTTDAPSARGAHTAVWTGNLMVVWGGADTSDVLSTGGRYDPAADAWTPTSTANAPPARFRHTAVWTGSVMVAWGGVQAIGVGLDSGGRYDPQADVWMSTSTAGVPEGRVLHTAVWTGGVVVVWGGSKNLNISSRLDTGGRYDPQTDTWASTSTTSAPEARAYHAAVSTGSRMIVWGGGGYDGGLNTGGRYDPATDTWTPTYTTNAPSARYHHTAVWTGNRMIVWGGHGYNATLDTGGRYDPATDAWSPTSMADAPSQRYLHTAVWTGEFMIVWGGWDPYFPGKGFLDTGGRYEPMTDTWTPTSTANAPSARIRHAVVWTGSRMIVWGGTNNQAFFGTGGRYDPHTDTWTPTTMVHAPAVRWSPSGTWTGSVMVVWGGQGTTALLNTGGRYDPQSDTWLQPTSTVNAPSPRYAHTALWTGTSMVVWGGVGWQDTGGRYDPVANTWTPISTTNAPEGRTGHTSVWTGSRMIVWGGFGSAVPLDNGGRYDPVADSWTPTSSVSAAQSRAHHTAVWADGWMIVWGGTGDSRLDTGGRYALGNSVDDDGDGLSECTGDCNDTDAGAFAVPAEVLGLEFAQDKVTLTWSSAAPSAGPGTVHDLVRGRLANLPVGGAGTECVATVAEASAMDSSTPLSGQGFWYIVRGRNTCGSGTYGFETGGAERTTSACP